MASAQEKKTAPVKTAPVKAVSPAPGAEQTAMPPKALPVRQPARANFSVIAGSITNIDNTDPAKPKLVVLSEKDNTTHTLDITPWTNITKATDISELKTGEKVRVMVRKLENNEVAVNVLFGKIRTAPPPRPITQARPPVQQPATPAKQE